MPTVIDSLIITLGLDASKYTAGQKQTAESLRKTKENAAQAAKEIKASGQQAAQFFTRLRNEAIALFSVFLAGRGIKDFIVDITRSDAAVGRAAHALGMATQELSAWQQAAERMGGSAADITQSFQSMSAEFEKVQQTGQGGEQWRIVLNRLGLSLRDTQGHAKTFSAIMLELADKFKGMDPREATYFGGLLGFSQQTVNTLSAGSEELQRQLERARKRGLPSEEDTRRAIELKNALLDIQDTITDLARKILNDMSPALVRIMGQFEAWLLDPETKQSIEDFITGIGQIAVQINKLVESTGGWVRVLKIMFALWAADKVGAMIASIGRISLAFLGVGNAVGGVTAKLGLMRLAIGALAAHEALAGVDPEDKMGSWIDKNVPGAAAIDDWFARKFGIGRTYEQQQQAAQGATPKPETPPPPSAPVTGNVGDLGLSPDQYDIFRSRIAGIESKGKYDIIGGAGNLYTGKYQFGATEIRETAAALGEKAPTRAEFMADPAMQERFMLQYTIGHHAWLMKHSPGYAAMTPEQRAAVLGYAHNQGAGGAAQWIATGKVGSDAFKTPGTAYSSAVTAGLRGTGGNPVADLGRGMYPTPSAQELLGNTTTANSNDNSLSLQTGPINIHTAATDAPGIARSMRASLDRMMLGAQANRGLA
jgi:hypothetical protein